MWNNYSYSVRNNLMKIIGITEYHPTNMFDPQNINIVSSNSLC